VPAKEAIISEIKYLQRIEHLAVVPFGLKQFFYKDIEKIPKRLLRIDRKNVGGANF
jgi:hypothetical protein